MEKADSRTKYSLVKKKALFYMIYIPLTTGMLYLVMYESRHDDFPTFHQDVLWQALGTTLLIHVVSGISRFMFHIKPSNNKPPTRKIV